jgi:hypothetical protein
VQPRQSAAFWQTESRRRALTDASGKNPENQEAVTVLPYKKVKNLIPKVKVASIQGFMAVQARWPAAFIRSHATART